MNTTTVVLRAFRFTLDPTAEPQADLNRHAGAARWAFNHALAVKLAAQRRWRAEVDALMTGGLTEAQARKTVTLIIPNHATIQKDLNRIKYEPRKGHHAPAPGMLGPHRPCHWWCAAPDAFRNGVRPGCPQTDSRLPGPDSRHVARWADQHVEHARPADRRGSRAAAARATAVDRLNDVITRLVNCSDTTTSWAGGGGSC